ncbi:egl nine1-like [Tropilaelaps mercedesae]|uniref:Egl nine1-like n=1 Tax=Tropilaelaps mercedesae TaxID=418985 RepID=A0A1V9X7J5_9ACAR|nr:egl nine1-like [Tropilaelaps mercedesae]
MLSNGRLLNVIHDMNKFGVCVVDGFPGQKTAHRRNLHEMMPVQRARLCITIWCLDDNELMVQTCVDSVFQQSIRQMTPFSLLD